MDFGVGRSKAMPIATKQAMTPIVAIIHNRLVMVLST
jgi:hypothetical protein